MAYTTIDNPELYFQVKTYTGTGSSLAITLDGDEDMQPDFVWIKERNLHSSSALTDSVRGTTEKLKSDENVATEINTNLITSFDSDGFSLGDNGNANQSPSQTYVAWCWKESATSGFDIVSYTGNGTDDTDISHNLSATPKMIMVKNRDATDDWAVYHAGNTANPHTDYLVLNEVDATADAADRWSDEAPTSSVFTLGDADEVNTDTEDYIAYCFAEKQGFSKFGSYTGNGSSTDGTFCFCGFKPSFVMVKRTDAEEGYGMFDTKRDTYNPVMKRIEANDNAVERTDLIWYDFYSNGFKARQSYDLVNADGGTYIYMAFAEAPFVNSNGVPCNAR